MGKTSAGLEADADAQDEPMDMTQPLLAVIFWSPLTPHEVVGSTTAGLKADYDGQDEPMDIVPPSLTVIFQYPTAQHEAVGSTTTGILHTSDTYRMGSHHPVSPELIRCHGRHR